MTLGRPDPDRVVRWLRAVAVGRADRVVEVPGGLAVLHTRYPAAHDHNQLVLWEPVTAREVVCAAEQVLGGAGVSTHRAWVLDALLADALEPGLLADGFAREHELTMWHPPGGGQRQARVVALGLDERVEAASAAWEQEQPGWPAEVTRQLGERVRSALDVVGATFLAVREQGTAVARADLFVRDGLAQVEEVVTNPASRNRGHATALVDEAVRRAGQVAVDGVFLVADAHDWPAGLYRRLGFAHLGVLATFSRS